MSKRYLQDEYAFDDMETDIEDFTNYLASCGANISHSESGNYINIQVRSTVNFYKEFENTLNLSGVIFK